MYMIDVHVYQTNLNKSTQGITIDINRYIQVELNGCYF